MIRSYVLPPGDAMRALEAGGPLVDLPVDPKKLKEMRVAVVEVDQQIVAYWVVWYALHLEPLWIKEEHRRSAGVAAGLLSALEEAVRSTGEPSAFCVIEEENLAAIEPYAARLGFQEAPGKLYYLVLQPAEALVRG